MEISKLYKQGGSVVVAVPVAIRKKANVQAGDSLIMLWNENVNRITMQKLVLGKEIKEGGEVGKR